MPLYSAVVNWHCDSALCICTLFSAFFLHLKNFVALQAEMGPQGLVVIEDCDRTVILAPAVLEAPHTGVPVSELRVLPEERAPAETSEKVGGRAHQTDLPLTGAEGPPSIVAVSRKNSSVSSGKSSTREDFTGVTRCVPPKPPDFLRAMTTPET